MGRKLIAPPDFNLADTYDKAHARWLISQRKSISLMDRIENGQPLGWLLLAIFLVVLTTSHTIQAFKQVVGGDFVIPAFNLTIPVAAAAVFVVDFGVLLSAFYRHDAKKRSEQVVGTLLLVEIVLCSASLIANIAGAIGVAAGVIEGQAGVERQVSVIMAFLMVPVAGVMMPLLLHNSGTLLARFVVNRRRGGDPLANKWHEEGPVVLHLAVSHELIRLGCTHAAANRLADGYVKLSFKQHIAVNAAKETKVPESPGKSEDRPKLERGIADKAVKGLYENYPDFARLPLAARAKLVQTECGASQTTAYGAIAKYESKLPTMGLGSHQDN